MPNWLRFLGRAAKEAAPAASTKHSRAEMVALILTLADEKAPQVNHYDRLVSDIKASRALVNCEGGVVSEETAKGVASNAIALYSAGLTQDAYLDLTRDSSASDVYGYIHSSGAFDEAVKLKINSRTMGRSTER